MVTPEEPSLCFIEDVEQHRMSDSQESDRSREKTEQEDVWDWVSGIGSGIAQGAAMGAAAGPYGALFGGLAGAGVGAVQTASQQQKRDSPAAAAQGPQPQGTVSQPRPPDQSTSLPSTPVSPSTAPGVSPQLIQQLLQLLPLLTQLLARQPGANAAGGARAESEDIQDSGDYVPDDAFTAIESTHQSGDRTPLESHEMAEGGMARQEESLLDWIIQPGNATHNTEWTQEGSIEVVPAMEWLVEGSHSVWED